MKSNCTLPHSEREELRDEVNIEQAKFDKNRALLVQIFEVAAPDAPLAEIEAFETHLDLLLQSHENLISAQNVALKAGLTARGD